VPTGKTSYAETPTWHAEQPKLRPAHLVLQWLVSAISLLVATWIVPGADVRNYWSAFVAAAVIALLNAVLPPLVAAIRLPFTLITGFLAVLVLDALMLMAADSITDGDLHISSFGVALAVALVASAVSLVIEIGAGVDDDSEYAFRVIQRVARRSGGREKSQEPGIVFLEIDGLGLPILRRAMRDGNAPNMARWVAEEGYKLTGWETDLSSQTGASQSGILLGSNEDIPAFRWVEKESGRLMTCSAPDDCEEIERRHTSGKGLLREGGASRGNLLSGEADEMILTVSRINAEKGANPGYRAFFANGFNVTRVLVLFGWELILEWVANLRSIRRDVRPRGHRGGPYPFIRAGMCVVVRDLIVYGVLTDMMAGRPAVYATFSSYDEVAHHSGLERADTLEALRKLDAQFGRIEKARRYAPRPYEIVVLSDHGQTQGPTFKQRNGYGLDDLVERSLSGGEVMEVADGDEQQSMVGHALGEATGQAGGEKKAKDKKDISGKSVIVLGSGNLGLVYLMDENRRLTKEEIDARHPELIPALRAHPHVGWILVHSQEHGALAMGAGGVRHLGNGQVDGIDPLSAFSPTAAQHLLRTDGFEHVADIMVGSFYDPDLDEGCAFEELISFHGGIGGAQTEAFILHSTELPLSGEPLIGAAHVNEVLRGWRSHVQPEFQRGQEPRAQVPEMPDPTEAV
jgi:uncharacterized membrane protein YvlD (DUF360 family)